MNELGPEARALFDAARGGDDPTDADRARIRASVMGALTSGAAGAAGVGAAGAKAGTVLGAGWKILLASLVVGVGVTTGVVAQRRAFSSAETPKPPLEAAIAPVPTVAAVAPPITASTAPVSTTAVVAIGDPNPNRQAQGAPSSDARVASVPRGAGRVTPPANAPPNDTPVEQPPAAPVATAPVVVATADPDTLRAETRGLRDARAALRGGDAAKALQLLDEGAAAGPQLREERAAARIFALCDLGRADDARAAAARFLAESPRSPLADRVRTSCAGR